MPLPITRLADELDAILFQEGLLTAAWQ